MLIAKLADGGMRDALSLLDLCVNAGEEITPQTVTQAAGLVDRSYLFDIAKAVGAGDAGAALAVLEGLWEKSIDYQRLCEQLIGFYRNVMVVRAVKNPDQLVACLPDEMEQYRSQAGELPMERVLYNLNTLQNTLARMSRTAQRRTELELGLLRLASPELDTSTEALQARIEALERAVRKGISAPQPAAPNAGDAAESAQKEQGRPKPDRETKAKEPPLPDEIKTKVEILAQWPEILKLLEKKNKALCGTLVEFTAYVSGDLLLVDAEGGMFARMVRGDSYAKESLRAVVEEVTGHKFRLGPYNPEKYAVEQDSNHQLGEILQQAQALGVDVTVKE